MKKRLVLITALVIALCLGACGGDTQPTAGSGTNYADTGNWLALPAETKFAADVIYFYPTTYKPESEDDPDICGIDNGSMREGAAVAFARQATAFETMADIYAPFYRQIDAGALAGMTQLEMIEAQSGEPKEDVFAALDYYFEHYNNGRPYILAGHSQGAMMIYIILQDYMKENPGNYENMVAAYMLGNAPTKDWLAANSHVKFAQEADDTGVLISWNSEGPGNAGKYNMVVPEGSVAINPLNWKTDGTPAGVGENLGSFVNGEIVAGIADARVDVERGALIVESVDPEVFAIPRVGEALFGPESYHSWDFMFFYMNIRENAMLRLERFLNSSR